MSSNAYDLVIDFNSNHTTQGVATFIKGVLVQLVDAGTDQAKLKSLIKDLQSAVLVVSATEESPI